MSTISSTTAYSDKDIIAFALSQPEGEAKKINNRWWITGNHNNIIAVNFGKGTPSGRGAIGETVDYIIRHNNKFYSSMNWNTGIILLKTSVYSDIDIARLNGGNPIQIDF